jgi:hypothetical protein
LNADREKRGKRRDDPEGTLGEIIFLFSAATLSLKETATNLPINNPMIDKLARSPRELIILMQ